jgi:hypothetical protein
MMVFDGPVHVGQLQFRSYMPDTVSPNGIMDPLYWMDFRGHAPRLSEKTIALFCFHVGQIDNTPARDSHYFGRGIGISLLRNTMAWAKDAGFEALIAKGCPGYRPVIEFMGGLPAEVYEKEGFEIAASYIDSDLRQAFEEMPQGSSSDNPGTALREIVDSGVSLDRAAEVSVCVRRF